MIGKLYVLKAPGGQLIAETATAYREIAWERGLQWMSRQSSMESMLLYVSHDAKRAAARRRGYRIVKAELVEVK